MSKKQIIHNDDKRLIIIFELNSIKKGQITYRVGYSIDKQTNDFCIEFYDKNSINDKFYHKVPIFLLKRFKEYDNNQFNYRLYKNCSSCQGYSYHSQYFTLNLSSPNLGQLNIHREFFQYLHYYNNKNYNIIIENNPNNTTSFSIINTDLNIFNMINVPKINFTTPEKVGNKLLKLLVFT